MLKKVVTLSAVILALGLAADQSIAAKKKINTTPKPKSAWAFCSQVCRKEYGPGANVHHLQTRKGKTYCWCVY